jgi:hypothetical protein
VAQEGCDKCCGNSAADRGTRTSFECPNQTCYWARCNNSPYCGSPYSIQCSGTACDYCTDACFAEYTKCPADEDIIGVCAHGCEYGF